MNRASIAVLAVGLCQLAAADPVPSTPWNLAFGRQYGFQAYAPAIRDIGSAHQWGYSALDADQDLAFADFQAHVAAEVSAHVVDAPAMTAQVGGLGSGRNLAAMQAYLDQVASDGGLQARDGFYRRALEIASIPGASQKFYWQIGNEINSQTFSSNLHLWAADGLPGVSHDPSTIPIIAEYFIAPAVSGIHQASSEVHGDDAAIRIMLGSIANSSGPQAQDFLVAMLDYTIVGTYAPSEAGKQVRDMVDTVSIHYMMGSTNWEEGLDSIRLGQFGRGRVSRVISTEEVGIRAADEGSGLLSALRTLGRYQYWWNLHGLGPDVSRAFFYGTGAGEPNLDTELPLLLDFTGTEPLLNPASPAILSGSGPIECREFEVGSTGKRLLLIFSGDRTDVAIDSVDLPWSPPLCIASADLYQTGLKSVVSPSATVSAGHADVRFGNLALVGDSVLVLRLEPDVAAPSIVSLSASGDPAVAGGTVILSVVASDDIGVASYSWLQTSGPAGGSAIASGASASTSVSFSQAGSYAFTVTVSDASGNAVSSVLDVAVATAPDVTAPSIVSLSASGDPAVAGGTVILSVVASDDIGVASYSWLQTSGPAGGSAIASGASASTSVSFSQAGSYAFTVTVSDASGNAVSPVLDVAVATAPDATAPPIVSLPASGGPVVAGGSGSGGCGLGGLSTLILGILGILACCGPVAIRSRPAPVERRPPPAPPC